MQSPPIEWTILIAPLVVLDIVRDHGEPDEDTLSECLRVGFQTDTARGRHILAASIAAGGVLLFRHLTKPEMRR